MKLPMRSHRYLLIVSFVTVLLLLVGLAPAMAQSDPRLEITAVDASAFPDMRVMVIATDGESLRRPDVGGLSLRENDTPVENYEVSEQPVGVELFVVIDANSDIDARDEAGGLTRKEKVRDSILLFAEQYMDSTQLDRITIIVPQEDGPSILLDNAIFPNEVINEMNFWDDDAVGNTRVNDMLALAIERAAASKEEGRFQAALLYSDAGRLDGELDYPFLTEQARAIDLPIFSAILGARADDSEITNVTGLTEPTRGNWVHMPQAEEIAPLFEKITGNRSQFELDYRSGLATEGSRMIIAELDGAQAQTEAVLEIVPPTAEIVVDNSRPIRRVTSGPDAPLTDAEPGSQPIAAQISWRDGYPRAVVEAVLVVNGTPQPVVTEPAIDDGGLMSLEWDISQLDEGAYDLTVQVVDELGLEGQSEPLPMTVIVEGMAGEESPAEIAPTAIPEDSDEPMSDEVAQSLSLVTIGIALLALFAAVVVLIVAVVLVRRRQAAPAPVAQAAPVAVQQAPADHDATQVIMPAFVKQAEATAYLEPLENAPDHHGNIAVSGDGMTIGRDAKLAQIVFADKSVSRLHARIVQSGGSFRLYDEGSASGTYVNYEPVGLTPQVLNNNDDVHIGRVHLKFHVSAVEDDADSTQIMPAPQAPQAPQQAVDDGMSTQPYMPQQPGQYQPPPEANDDEDDISTQPFMPHQPNR